MKARTTDTARQDLGGSLSGDKVRIKTGSRAGERGILEVAADGALSVSLETGETVPVLGMELTNFSLAARRAWKVMPKRAGRPASAGSQKKMVSIRIDSQVWELLSRAVDLGLIPSREQAINTWLRQRTDEILEQIVCRDQQLAEGSNA